VKRQPHREKTDFRRGVGAHWATDRIYQKEKLSTSELVDRAETALRKNWEERSVEEKQGRRMFLKKTKTLRGGGGAAKQLSHYSAA